MPQTEFDAKKSKAEIDLDGKLAMSPLEIAKLIRTMGRESAERTMPFAIAFLCRSDGEKTLFPFEYVGLALTTSLAAIPKNPTALDIGFSELYVRNGDVDGGITWNKPKEKFADYDFLNPLLPNWLRIPTSDNNSVAGASSAAYVVINNLLLGESGFYRPMSTYVKPHKVGLIIQIGPQAVAQFLEQPSPLRLLHRGGVDSRTSEVLAKTRFFGDVTRQPYSGNLKKLPVLAADFARQSLMHRLESASAAAYSSNSRIQRMHASLSIYKQADFELFDILAAAQGVGLDKDETPVPSLFNSRHMIVPAKYIADLQNK